jgi:hypothetical protein
MHCTVFINSHINVRSYEFHCQLAPSSGSPIPTVVPSQHIKWLRSLTTLVFKDRSLYYKRTCSSIIEVLTLNIHLVKQLRVKITDVQLFNTIKILHLDRRVVKRNES